MIPIPFNVEKQLVCEGGKDGFIECDIPTFRVSRKVRLSFDHNSL